MKPNPLAFGYVGLLSLFLPVSAWPQWLPALDALVVRGASPSVASNPSGPSTTQPPQAPEQTNLNTAVAPSGTGPFQSPPTETEFPQVDPAGGVVMVTPAAALGSQLYKAGSWITLGWTYTNLQATPTGIDVILRCSNTATWTLTSNMTFATSAAFLWDSAPQASDVQQPLKPDTYTLVIYEADTQITAAPDSGYLAPFSGFSFGIYTPQPYTPLTNWTCPTCNSAAPTIISRRSLSLTIAMSLLTYVGFDWLLSGLMAALA